ncbi:MAG: PDZ domain-containing protein [Cellulomonas sp.]|nr:PDZ domain-containing protein [Cellulomonas sp.]
MSEPNPFVVPPTEPVPPFPEPEGAPAVRYSPRSITLSASLLVSALLAAVLAVLPAPYVVDSPGPTKNVLGEQDGTPLISISGATTYDSTGELRLTTVSEVGSPGYPALAPEVVAGWLSRWAVVRPSDTSQESGQTQEQVEQTNAAQMVSSQENATVAALTELGYEVPATLTVAGVQDGTGATGVLAKGDVITAINGTALPDYARLVSVLAGVTPGSTITVSVQRDGAPVEVPVVTGTRPDGGALIGVYIDPTFDPPVDVKISIDGIGGPSAGTMFALGIIDRMTPQDEANGQVIAGTGTIDVTGAVGEIGGIRQKLAGAGRDGATWFLAPSGNCAEVVGHVPDGLRVVAVSTLHEAREAVVAIGAGDGGSLPTCTASS